MAAGNIANVTITGTCAITFRGLDLGHTFGGIEIKGGRTFKDVVVDKYGTMPIDMILTGSSLEVTMTLAEGSWRTLRNAMDETSSATNNALLQRADFGADSGYSARSQAGLLVIHPMKNNVADFTEDVNVYRAFSSQPITLPYKIDAQKVIQLTFTALVDETYGSGRRLGHVGTAAVS